MGHSLAVRVRKDGETELPVRPIWASKPGTRPSWKTISSPWYVCRCKIARFGEVDVVVDNKPWRCKSRMALRGKGGGLVNHHLEPFDRVDGVGNETDGAAELL